MDDGATQVVVPYLVRTMAMRADRVPIIVVVTVFVAVGVAIAAIVALATLAVLEAPPSTVVAGVVLVAVVVAKVAVVIKHALHNLQRAPLACSGIFYKRRGKRDYHCTPHCAS